MRCLLAATLNVQFKHSIDRFQTNQCLLTSSGSKILVNVLEKNEYSTDLISLGSEVSLFLWVTSHLLIAVLVYSQCIKQKVGLILWEGALWTEKVNNDFSNLMVKRCCTEGSAGTRKYVCPFFFETKMVSKVRLISVPWRSPCTFLRRVCALFTSSRFLTSIPMK